jgi:general transcription factor 3C polypeptide 5 (transcription factor C subunit 1)
MQNNPSSPSGSGAATPPQSQAPEHPLPQTAFYSVEYPGYVRPTSVPLAVNNLGGQAAIDNAFRRATSKTDTLLELKLRPGQPFAHSVPGEVVGTNNILLKVTKRKRKKRPEGVLEDGAIGEYVAEAVGVIPKTARFRSQCILSCCFASWLWMASYRYGGLSIPA